MFQKIEPKKKKKKGSHKGLISVLIYAPLYDTYIFFGLFLKSIEKKKKKEEEKRNLPLAQRGFHQRSSAWQCYNLGRLPLVRIGRPDRSICKENSTFNQHCPTRSVYFYIVCIAVMVFERKLSKEAYFIFKMTGPTGQFGLLVSALRPQSRSI